MILHVSLKPLIVASAHCLNHNKCLSSAVELVSAVINWVRYSQYIMIGWSYGDAHDDKSHDNCCYVSRIIQTYTAVSTEIGRKSAPLWVYSPILIIIISMGQFNLGPLYSNARTIRISLSLCISGLHSPILGACPVGSNIYS